MEIKTKTFGFDGTDEIIYSESFNLYEDELVIDFLDRKFKFIFENSEPAVGQSDLSLNWINNEAIVTISKKFRNNIGSATTGKIEILKTSDAKKILFSIFGQQVGNIKLLHVTVNFYQR